jgi:uncharacterized protein YfdQ (DUF2303 family)
MGDEEMQGSPSDVEVALTAGMMIGDTREVNGNPFMLVPEGAKIEDLGHYLPRPPRLDRNAELYSAKGFIDYVNRFKLEESLLYSRVNPSAQIVAVIDEASRFDASHRSHLASYTPKLSRQWKEWTDMAGKHMNQVELAAFIERRMADVVSPAGAELLEMVQRFQATKTVKFTSGERASNGQVELVYVETIEAKAGSKGQFRIPEKILLGIPVLHKGTPYKVEVFLRYRVGDGTLKMWIDIVDRDAIFEHAIDETWQLIATSTGLPMVEGAHG